jgi:phosphoglycolate phosphatase
MAPPVRAVVFDLDGTLVQTRVASWEVFSQINDRFGLGVDSPERYFDLFRSNVFASIRSLCRDEAHADEVKAAFLALLRTDYTPAMIPGMTDVVRRLAGDCTLAVMSSNAMQVLRRVLVTNDLAFCFAHVFGGDVAPDKRAAIRAFLADSGSGFGRRCAADYDEAGQHAEPAAASTVLVTDTAGDVRDARETGIRVVGVAWGMHSVDELLDAGAEFVALWPQEITAYLLGDASVEPPGGACAVPARPAEKDCGCGCSGADKQDDPIRAAAAARRRRRAAARAQVLAALPAAPTPGGRKATFPQPGGRKAASLQSAAVPAELLAAVRAVCADG